MPQIQEYLPQTEGQQPEGGLSANLEAVSVFGRGIQDLGSMVSQGGQVLERRQAQQEVSSSYSQWAQFRTQKLTEINQGIQDGSLDTDKLKQDVQDFTNKQYDQLSTFQGKDFANKQASRVGGYLLQHAATGQAVIAKNTAVSDYDHGVAADAQSYTQDPSLQNFQSSMLGQAERLQMHVTGGVDENGQGVPGGIDAKDVPKILDDTNQKLTTAFVQSVAKNDPDAAQKMIDDGRFNAFMKGGPKPLYDIVEQQRRMKTAQASQLDRQADQARKDAYYQWGQDNIKVGGDGKPVINLSGLNNATFMSPEQRMHLIQAGLNAKKERAATDPVLFNNIDKRINDPNDPHPITDMSQITPFLNNGLDGHAYEHFQSKLANTPQAQQRKSLNTLMIKDASKQLTDLNSKTDYGSLMQFQMDMANKQKDLMKQGQDPNSLYDKKSPNFYGLSVGNYIKPMEEKMQERIDQLRKQSGGQASPTGEVQPQRVMIQDKAGNRYTVDPAKLQDKLKTGNYTEVK